MFDVCLSVDARQGMTPGGRAFPRAFEVRKDEMRIRALGRKPAFRAASAARFVGGVSCLLAGLIPAVALEAIPVAKPPIERAVASGSVEMGTIVRLPPRKPSDAGAMASPAVSQTSTGAARPSSRDAAAPVPASITGVALAPSNAANLTLLRKALTHIDKGRIADAMTARNGLGQTLEQRIVDWRLIVKGAPAVDAAFISRFAAAAPHWPSPELMRRRAETVLFRAKQPPRAVIDAFRMTPPETPNGKIALARAHLALGQSGRAAQILAPLWRTEALAAYQVSTIIPDLAGPLTADDHRARIEMLLYRERVSDAERVARRLNANERAYVAARAAALRGEKDALSRLSKLPRDFHSRPGYALAQAEALRKAGRIEAAADWLDKAPRDRKRLIDPDAWWTERRIVSRDLLEAGDARRAYAIAAAHLAQGNAVFAEAEWHAGWYALRFLNDPARAERHFAAIAKIGRTPITLARAYYWRGRAAEARGQTGAARQHYGAAATHGATYYGQLARERLGKRDLGLPKSVAPRAADRQAFARNDIVQAIQLMDRAGFARRSWMLFDHLSKTLPSAGQLALLVRLAEEIGRPHWALSVGKRASRRFADAAILAFPTTAIPADARIAAVEKPLVYAIARQESGFNPAAVSRAGALGLMQFMPATAKRTARDAGLRYSQSRLTTDPAFNATLGAVHLRELIEEFDGSYILAFAAYNAGKRRAAEWVARFGDPRHSRVDAVDWVEQISFTETRNYVQRVMENLQVYRYLLADKPLAISADLRRPER